MHLSVVDVFKPQVGGIIPVGSKTVFINKLPAGQNPDVIVEVGAPNPIAPGAPNVIIGGRCLPESLDRIRMDQVSFVSRPCFC